jgi:hypothetical protein
MEPGQLHRENAGYLIAASSLEQALMRWNRVRAVGWAKARADRFAQSIRA